jgi:hypothetical protein
MSVASYIGRKRKELKIPREAVDDVGIRYGAPEWRAREDARPAPPRNGEEYAKVEGYDPVLWSHCRL